MYCQWGKTHSGSCITRPIFGSGEIARCTCRRVLFVAQFRIRLTWMWQKSSEEKRYLEGMELQDSISEKQAVDFVCVGGGNTRIRAVLPVRDFVQWPDDDVDLIYCWVRSGNLFSLWQRILKNEIGGRNRQLYSKVNSKLPVCIFLCFLKSTTKTQELPETWVVLAWGMGRKHCGSIFSALQWTSSSPKYPPTEINKISQSSAFWFNSFG